MEDTSKMYVFMDESGDAGFKIDQGSSPYLCIAAVVFADCEAITETEAVIAALRSELRFPSRYEFHFNHESPDVREKFCQAMAGCRFTVSCIVIDKTKIHQGTVLRRSSQYFYNFITRMLLQHNLGDIANAKIVIDGKTNPALKTYLRKQLNQEKRVVRSVVFSNSATDPMIQLADMVVGSIARSYKLDKRNCLACRQMLEHQRRVSVWEFGREA
jgi:hypothetical protein